MCRVQDPGKSTDENAVLCRDPEEFQNSRQTFDLNSANNLCAIWAGPANCTSRARVFMMIRLECQSVCFSKNFDHFDRFIAVPGGVADESGDFGAVSVNEHRYGD